MRITQSMILRSHTRELSLAYTRLFDVQEQLASGKKILKPSDDPSAIRPALDLRSSLRRLDQVRKNADLATSELGTAVGILQNASDIVSRAKEIAINGATGSINQSDRDAMAIEVDGLLNQMIALGNSRGLSGFLFGGSVKNTPPFQEVKTSNDSYVKYGGDDKTNAVDLGDGLRLELNVPGSAVFGIGTRTTTVYQGITGAAAGTGNDSARGSNHLTVTHVQTVLGDGAVGGTGDSASGLQIGASSNSADTVVGPANSHVITLTDTSGTGASGTLSIDGGPAMTWTAGDSDLAIPTPDGGLVHLDLSNVTAGFSGSVGIAASGTMSLDGGLTATAIDFTQQNQVLTDSETGGTMFVDARNIRRAGTDLVRSPGSYDLFNALIELREALKNKDGLTGDAQLARIRETVGSFSEGEDKILAALSQLGARQRLAETTKSRTDDLNQLLTENQSNLEDVDFAGASVDLAEAQLVLQAGVQVSAKIANLPTLVNLL